MSHQSDLIASDIHSYLKQHENKELLRFLTCGSVDDGKSTLIGRLLHDSKMIYEDQLAEINADNKRTGNAGEHLDLALLVDGLQAEREQGITIDVAYRYFSTDRRKFIIADTPGHEQYTRNMATGASNCDLAIILIDARHGVQTQTRRHSFIASLLGIKQTIVAINKMDLVDFSESRYEQIKSDYLKFTAQLNQAEVQFVPISALNGDNVVNRSDTMSWYQGEPLMGTLENIKITSGINLEALRFPVQYVNRPNQHFRGYAGTLTSGIVHPGDEVTVLPSGRSTRVQSIVTYDDELQEAFPPMSVTLTLEDEIDISRGDVIVHSNKIPASSQRFDASLVWMTETPLVLGKRYEIKLSSKTVAAKVSRIHHQIDVNTLEQSPSDQLTLNSIARCELTLETPVVADDYQQHKGTGSFILIDHMTNATVAAGMVHGTQLRDSSEIIDLPQASLLTPIEKAAQFGQKPVPIVLTGACQETRTGLLFHLEKTLINHGHAVAIIQEDDSLLPPEILAHYLIQQGLLVLTDTKALSELESAIVLSLGSGKENDSSSTDTQVEQLILTLQEKGII